MPPNTLPPRQPSHADAHNGHIATIGAFIRIGLARAYLRSRRTVIHTGQILLTAMVVSGEILAQEDCRLDPDYVFSDPIDAGKSISPWQREHGVSIDRQVQRATWNPDPRARRQVSDEMSSKRPSTNRMKEVAELAASDASPLVRETARLQLIEWQYSTDPGDSLKSTPPGRVRPIGFNTVLDPPDFDVPVSNDIQLETRNLVAEPETSVEWLHNQENSPNAKEPAVQLIKEEFLDERPNVLRSPFPPLFESDEFMPQDPDISRITQTPFDAPLGFSGLSSILPTESQESEHFVPMEDRWRIGFPEWDRYGKGNPDVDDQPYETGHWWDPYNQNMLKGDYPVIGQHTFLNITATNELLNELREVPTATTPFESTVDPNQPEFFGNPQQYFLNNNLKLQFNLSHGDTAFKPFDWQIRMTPVFNLNYLSVKELGVVNPDVRAGTTRFRQEVALEEWFAEAKLADLSPNYDFMSVRAGSQPFVSDFRGFIFSDTNRAVRLFGTRLANRDQFNLIYFDQTEKDTNSGLNTFHDRRQNTLIANYFRQDFIFPGFTTQFSFHYNHDGPSVEFDRNDFLVRPDPAGVFRPHRVEAYYFGVAGDGHIGRVNVNHAFYHVEGTVSLNPIQGQKSQIRANMAAIELSIDRDWVRFKTSYFWASGDGNPNDCKATGFDSIFDNPNFAGGQFSYWQRQAIRLFGVNLVQRESLLPDLRSSKTQGQSNFVNPGLQLLNAGMDFEITPKVKAITNANLLWFNKTQTLERFVFQDNIHHHIGTDLSLGFEYRPLLSDNVIVVGGISTLIPGQGFDDLFGVTDPFSVANAQPGKADALRALFLNVVLAY